MFLQREGGRFRGRREGGVTGKRESYSAIWESVVLGDVFDKSYEKQCPVPHTPPRAWAGWRGGLRVWKEQERDR